MIKMKKNMPGVYEELMNKAYAELRNGRFCFLRARRA